MNTEKKFDYRVYVVTDESLPEEDLLAAVEKSVKGGATIVQLREKSGSGLDFYRKAVRLKRLLDSYSVPLIINDRLDIAMAVQAAGVHIGQEDIPASAVRAVLPGNMIMGVSVRTPEEAKSAVQDGADYVGAGAVRPTGTKADAELLSEAMLESIVKSVQVPVIAIGGIRPEHMTGLIEIGVSGAAAVSAIMHAPDPRLAAALFKAAWEFQLSSQVDIASYRPSTR